MGKLAFVFPGQGSQSVGMGQDLAENFAEAKALYAQVDAAAGRSLSTLCFNGPEEELKRTINTQPTILATSLAAHAAFAAELKHAMPQPDFVAGHSLGEITALCVASALSVDDAVKLVEKRAALMQDCPKGAMSAVLKLSESTLEAICQEVTAEFHSSAPAEIVLIANYNTRDQLVISGSPEAVSRAGALVKERGGKAIPLPVGGAFHSPLMTPAAKEFSTVLGGIKFADTRCEVVQNVDAQGAKAGDVLKEKLSRQMESAVRWTACVEYLLAHGVDTVVEIGPGKVLTGLIKKIDTEEKIKLFNVFDSASLKATADSLKVAVG